MWRRCGQIVVEMQKRAAAGDQNRRMQRIDAVQPDRRGRETEGEAAAAGGDAADEGAEPQNGERVERKSDNHRVSPR